MQSRFYSALIAIVCLTQIEISAAEKDAAALRKSVTFYASFDEEMKGDFGDGGMSPSTRYDHPKEKGKFVFEKGFDPKIFRIAKQRGIHGGALEGVDVMPRRGRVFFPAKGNLAFKPDGWGGSVSMWLNTDPNKMLKTSYCDPIQITEKRAGDGGIWCDFPNVKPRDFRLGAFRGLAKGEKSVPESDPNAPLIRVKDIGFKAGEWHHVVMTWTNFDTGKKNARASLYIDGKLIGELTDREIAMKWNVDKTGIYFAVSYIGLLDELALFNRPLTLDEVKNLNSNPGLLSQLKQASVDAGAALIRKLTERVAKVRDADGDDHRVTQLRNEIHQFMKSTSGRERLEQSITLLRRLPAQSKLPPEAPKFPFDAAAAQRYQMEYAAWSGLPVEVTNRVGIKLRLVPPGTFVMGSPENEPGHKISPYDESQHSVRLTRPFYLSKHETTVEQFRRFVDAMKYTTDGERNGGGHAHDDQAVWKHRPETSWRKPGYAGPFELHDEHPVVHVSHTDCKEFCHWLNKRREGEAPAKAKRDRNNKRLGRSLALLVYDLPTEAQWEWSCRAGSESRYWWGEDVDTSGKVVNVGDRTLKEVHPKWPRETMPMNDRHAFPAPVGSYSANAFGVHDMLGNVWEFCSTRYGPYPQKLSIDPGDLDPKRGFAVRGGGWSNQPNDARCATRNADPPHFCHSNLGFRVALLLSAPDDL